jgi:hypothetical protein
MRAFIIVALFGLLFLTHCTFQRSPSVYNARGIFVGEIHVSDTNEAEVIDRYNQLSGKIRGGMVRDALGKRLGKVVAAEDRVSILSETGASIGSLANRTECKDAQDKTLGRITVQTDNEAAAGACLLLLISKELPSK